MNDKFTLDSSVSYTNADCIVTIKLHKRGFNHYMVELNHGARKLQCKEYNKVPRVTMVKKRTLLPLCIREETEGTSFQVLSS